MEIERHDDPDKRQEEEVMLYARTYWKLRQENKNKICKE
jgi:hypothetical protein